MDIEMRITVDDDSTITGWDNFRFFEPFALKAQHTYVIDIKDGTAYLYQLVSETDVV